MQNPPPVGLNNSDAELVDINADGLPDVVYSPSNGYRFYLNRGQGRFAAEPIFPEQSPGDRISNPNTSMVDVTGNGQVDLVFKDSRRFHYYPGDNASTWELGSRIDYNISPNFALNPLV